MEIFLTTLLKPFVVLVVMVGIVYPIKKLLWHIIPDGKIKEALFRRRGE